MMVQEQLRTVIFSIYTTVVTQYNEVAHCHGDVASSSGFVPTDVPYCVANNCAVGDMYRCVHWLYIYLSEIKLSSTVFSL